METAYFRPVNDFRSPGRAPRCKPEVDDDVMDGTATLLDESEEWAKVCKKTALLLQLIDETVLIWVSGLRQLLTDFSQTVENCSQSWPCNLQSVMLKFWSWSKTRTRKMRTLTLVVLLMSTQVKILLCWHREAKNVKPTSVNHI